MEGLNSQNPEAKPIRSISEFKRKEDRIEANKQRIKVLGEELIEKLKEVKRKQELFRRGTLALEALNYVERAAKDLQDKRDALKNENDLITKGLFDVPLEEEEINESLDNWGEMTG